MRVLTLIKYSEQLGPAPASFGAGMARDLPELDTKVVMVDSRALLPTAVAGAVVRTSGASAATLVDGPFTESKELIAGYSITEVDTFEQAIDAARIFLDLSAKHWPGWSGEAEVRQIAEF